MRHINSRTHPYVKRVTLLHSSTGRAEYDLFIAEGIRTCSTLIAGGMVLDSSYFTDTKFLNIIPSLEQRPLIRVSEAIMAKISTATTPSGLLCVFRIPAYSDFSDLAPGLVLAQISDPGNMGTIIRSAVAFGIKRITHINCVDVWSPKVVQAAVGTHAYVEFHKTGFAFVHKNKKDMKVYALVAGGGERPESIDTTRDILVIGGEAHGIPPEILSLCDAWITLPMTPVVESLNAAVAGSIALYLSFSLRAQ